MQHSVEPYYTGLLPSFLDASTLVFKLHAEEKLSFDEIEKRLRRLRLPIYLFGEETEKSLYTKGMRTKPGAFALMIAVKRCREHALLVADPGCADPKANLKRLQTTTAMFMGDSLDDILNFVKQRVDFMCSDDYIPVSQGYVPKVCTVFQDYFAQHPDKAAILKRKKITMYELDQETVAQMTLDAH